MRQVLSIWLPHLAIERWAKSNNLPPEAPVVFTIQGTHGLLIHAVTKAAAERGAHPGARLTDARALEPGLIAIPADPSADIALVERLARWAHRWSPLVEIDGADGLRLDISGVAHLFGGEKGLAHEVRTRLASLGLTAQIAIAPTASAAWALAHHAPCLCRTDELEERLAPLPVCALRLEEETVLTLERLGLKTIHALTQLPRLALARRFRGAEDVVDALDRALNRKPEPLTAAPSDLPPCASLRLEEPATYDEAPSQALEWLIPKLVRQLEERRLGARWLSLTGFRVDGSVALANVATAIPSRDPKHLQRLLADKAATLNPEFGFDAFALTANWTEELGTAQESLVEEPSGECEIARLIDRLTVKLGSGVVRKPQAKESHLPERASGWIPAISSSRHAKRHGDLELDCFAPLAMTTRSQRLLDRPQAIDVIYATPQGMPRRFIWRRAVHDIARVEGPERIAPEWWRQPSTSRLRDYYRVEDADGRRYWIYREGLIGDGRGALPNWFMHGLFG